MRSWFCCGRVGDETAFSGGNWIEQCYIAFVLANKLFSPPCPRAVLLTYCMVRVCWRVVGVRNVIADWLIGESCHLRLVIVGTCHPQLVGRWDISLIGWLVRHAISDWLVSWDCEYRIRSLCCCWVQCLERNHTSSAVSTPVYPCSLLFHDRILLFVLVYFLKIEKFSQLWSKIGGVMLFLEGDVKKNANENWSERLICFFSYSLLLTFCCFCIPFVKRPFYAAIQVCGDFNSDVRSAVYELMSTQSVSPEHPDLSNDPCHVLPDASELTHSELLNRSFSVFDGSSFFFSFYFCAFLFLFT